MIKLKPIFKDPLLALSWSALFAILLIPATLASGSISTGNSGVSQFGQIYKQGKMVFFRKVACSRSGPAPSSATS